MGVTEVISQLKCPVSTIAMGMAVSPPSLILAAGSKGRRLSTYNTRILIQQPQGLLMGSIDEVRIQTTELKRITALITTFYSKFTGLKQECIQKEINRDNYLSPLIAKD